MIIINSEERHPFAYIYVASTCVSFSHNTVLVRNTYDSLRTTNLNLFADSKAKLDSKLKERMVTLQEGSQAKTRKMMMMEVYKQMS